MQKENSVALTAGICNIPLTLPAIPYFITDDNNTVYDIQNMLSSFGILYQKEITPTDKTRIWSLEKIDSKTIKQIFRNFRTLKPRLLSEYRYLFWEIDNQDEETLNQVIEVFKFLSLPVYVHKTYRGYHFLSVKPLEKLTWDWAIRSLRNTNPRFPPVTLRVLANKYDNELQYFKEGFCYYPKDKIHKDTEYLRKFIENQDVISLEQYYMIVFYRLPEQDKLDNMTIEERNNFQENQIANSEENRIV